MEQERSFEEEFNKFIKKWCGNHFAHLVDSDENDGQEMREFVEENYLSKQRVKDAIEHCLVHGYVGDGTVHSGNCRMCKLLKEIGVE